MGHNDLPARECVMFSMPTRRGGLQYRFQAGFSQQLCAVTLLVKPGEELQTMIINQKFIKTVLVESRESKELDAETALSNPADCSEFYD